MNYNDLKMPTDTELLKQFDDVLNELDYLEGDYYCSDDEDERDELSEQIIEFEKEKDIIESILDDRGIEFVR